MADRDGIDRGEGMMGRVVLCCCVCLVVFAEPVGAQTVAEKLEDALAPLRIDGLVHSAVGVTRQQTPIPCVLTADDLDYETKRTRVLVVGGLDGAPESVAAAVSAVRWFYASASAAEYREQFAVSAVPCANPDGWASGTGPANGAGGNPTRGYPPEGEAYHSATDPEAAYLWRWIGMHAPDLVLVLEAGEGAGLRWVIGTDDGLREVVGALRRAEAETAPAKRGGLIAALAEFAPSSTGTVPALGARIVNGVGSGILQELLAACVEAEVRGPSPARREIQRRLQRTPLEVAEQLARHYGHKLPQVTYIPAVALIGRLRLSELTGQAQYLADVERIVAPYASGESSALPQQASGSHLSGHLVFSELAKVTGKEEYAALARKAADLGFDDASDGPREAMPYHLEMSDSVFMGGPILAQVGRLTGERKYFDLCASHIRFLAKLNLRADGLHRHSPLNETAWGRGNGFPALGLALCLSDFPEEHPDRDVLLQAFRDHVEALVRHQDPTGTWHQVIDKEFSYRELSGTCMITFALARGVRRGWLDRERYSLAIERGWYAIRTRVAEDGTLVDVCTGTGKQKSLRDYLDRTAILGRDDRGGAMALLVATEVAVLQRGD